MEELLFNYALHIKKFISHSLGEEVEQQLRNTKIDEDNYEEIEKKIKNIILEYFARLSNEDYFDIANNIYNCYVESDDMEIIKALKFILRIYTKFHQLKLRKYLHRWKLNFPIKKNKQKTAISNKNESRTKVIKIEKDDLINQHNSRTMNAAQNIFNKLYMDALIKQDKKLLNDEIKKLSELEECTFQPNTERNAKWN